MQIHHLYRPFGGGERYLLDLCSALEERGHEVVIISSRHRNNYARGEGRKEYFIDGSFGIRSGYRMAGTIKDIIRQENPDVVHLHETLVFLSPLIIGWLMKIKPTIQSLHTAFFFALRGQRYYPIRRFAVMRWGLCA